MAPTNKALVPNRNKMAGSSDLTEKAVVLYKNHRAGGESEIHASTERALVLRQAAGELVVSKKISGQDKLALLADELMATAVRPRLDMDELYRIADSQLWLHLSEISNLKDPLFFYDDINTAVQSRIEAAPDKDGRKPSLISNPRWIASVIGSRVHNLYLLSAGWKIVKTAVQDLKAMHLDASEVREQLARNNKMREKYLLLYDMTTTLARLGQQRVANIAAATPHYAKFFHVRTGKGDPEPQLEFDRQNSDLRQLRQAHKSFIDSIVLELVLPNSSYPPHVLMTLLRDAIDECKKEELRFSQALWDAIGDFSMTLQALDLIEGPLLGEQGDAWLRNSVLSKEYVEFLRMQDTSQKVIKNSSSWGTCFGRLIDTKDKACLDLLWKTINASCRQVTGKTMEALWSLQGEMQRPAKWSSTFNADMVSDSSDDDSRALVLHPNPVRKANKGMDRLRITNSSRVDDDDDDDEMPDLVNLSDSSEEADEDGSERSHDDDDDYESDFDPIEDEICQEDLHAAMDRMIDLFLEADPAILEEEKKSSNPFVKMFANLRDRFFAADPTLQPNEQSRKPYKRFGASAFSASAQPATTGAEPSKPKAQKVTVEDVEDEDAQQSKKKKKKKKKKTKKPQDQHTRQQADEQGEEAQDQAPEPPLVPVSPPRTITPVQSPPPKSLQSPQPSPKSVQPTPNKPKSTPTKYPENNFSQITLPTTETAQSARSYLQAENLIAEKSKVKSRPAFASKFFNSGGDKESKDKDGEDAPKGDGLLQKIKKINLPKKAGELMHRLIGGTDGKTHAKKPMKWDDFVKVMRVMGFTYVPGTAGSSVRFDAPHPGDPSVTFHKPHPDSTLQRHHLRAFGKKLTKTYGWREEMFSTFGIEEHEPIEEEEE